MASDKRAPHSEDCEKGVIGSMIVGGPKTIGEVYERIRLDQDDWFFTPALATIYRVLIEGWRDGTPTDLLTLTEALRNQKLLEQVGGAGFITGLTTFVPGAANVAYYLDEISDKRWLRHAITIGNEISRQALENQGDVEGTLRDVEEALMRLTQRHISFSKQRTISEITTKVIENLEDPEKALGLSTGFPKLDALVGGLAPCVKIAIAGRTSAGKSAFAANIARAIAVIGKVPTAIFTFEMSAEQWVQRVIQIHAATSARKVVGRDLNLFAVQKFQTAASQVAASKLTVTDDRLDIAGIRARCMQIKPRVVIIDYLQIVPERKQKGESTTDKLDRMSSETKQIAHQLGITVIELSQLTYDERAGTYKTRFSQGITNDSDQLWVLEGDDDETKDVIDKDIAVAKQREGRRGKVHFTFDKPCTLFMEKKN